MAPQRPERNTRASTVSHPTGETDAAIDTAWTSERGPGIQERSYPPHCSTSQRHIVDAADRHQDAHREGASPSAGRLHAQDIGVQTFPGEPLPAISLLANHQDRHPPLDDCPSTDSPAAQLTFAPA